MICDFLICQYTAILRTADLLANLDFFVKKLKLAEIKSAN